ncbi:TonB-dependent receptor family protein [Zestomonas carbonaria]|uniref:TonB-dependent receptor family protein n=1 Tax=Zestomonas carbonaria TaxID=2762745 RepID=UPI001F1F4181|nr:TonB-dependent receptor [Pseudomonas carbonaria]
MGDEQAARRTSADDTADDTRLSTVVVQADKATPAQQARTRLQEVAGGTSVVDSEELARGRNTTLGDVLAYQPGVFVQSVGGNDSVKISIRGSGIVNSPGYFREGIKFLYDGIALTGTGGTTYELLNASGVDYTEILRGGNAFDYGALALGGAVNFVTHTGHTAPGHRLRYETGSWGLQKALFSTGGAEGDFDYYVNVDNYRSDGYRRDYSLSKSYGTVVNLGYRFSPQLESRLLLRYRDEFHQDPGALTLPELEHDSSQASPTSLASRSSGRRKGTIWLGSKTNYTFDDGSGFEFGLAYHEYPHANNKDNTVGNPGFWDWHDLNASLRYARTDFWGGHESRTSLSFTSTEHLIGQVTTLKGNDRSQVVNKKFFKGSMDRTFTVGNDLELVDGLWLTSGVSAVYVRRNIDIAYSNQTTTPGETDYDNWSLVPRIGLRYELTPELQVFGNFTRSIDPPLDWRYANSRDQITPLVEQKANTLEVGIKGRAGIFDGSLAIYRSWIRDELLTVVDEEETARQGNIVTATFNSSTPTLHQGVELGLDGRLWESPGGEQIVLRQVYTYNDFRYRDDPRLGDNRLPGIPEHIYQAKLEYLHPSGFYGGVNVQAASRTAVDYTNTLYAPSYTIWGATAGYEAPSKDWKVYLDLKNLTDEDYVTTVTAAFDTRGNENSRNFFPGDGFGAFAGVELRF